MTKTELKMILKLIDLYTNEVETYYQSYDTRISDVSGLKKAICDLFEEENKDKQIRKKVVQEIREIFDFDKYENEMQNPEIRVSYKLFKEILNKVEGGEDGKID